MAGFGKSNLVAVALAMSAAITVAPIAASPKAPAGDPVRGAQVYAASCGACHSLDANRVGPAHRGVFGRRAGTASGYSYSPALRAARFSWTVENLDRWLTNPSAMVPGTRMGFRLSDAGRRADVIAFLRQQGTRVR